MNQQASTRLPMLLWLAVLFLFVAVAVFPTSTRLTRTSGLILLLVTWFGVLAVFWRSRVVRYSWLAITVLSLALLAWPTRSAPVAASLRGDYVRALGRYEGVGYVLGGESPAGIDSSGLIRRGLIDALFWRGLRNFDGGLTREALALWWRDSSAEDLGDGRAQFTSRLFETPSVNQLDPTRLLPGDLAMTTNGLHIMAYLGGQRWIEADPALGRVIVVSVPASGNAWFETPMKIVRWKIFED